MKKYHFFLLLFVFVFSIPLFASGCSEFNDKPHNEPNKYYSRVSFFGTVYKKYKNKGNQEQYPLDGIKLIVTKISEDYNHEIYTDSSGNFTISDYPGDNDFGEYNISLYINEKFLGTSEIINITENEIILEITVNQNDEIEIMFVDT